MQNNDKICLKHFNKKQVLIKSCISFNNYFYTFMSVERVMLTRHKLPVLFLYIVFSFGRLLLWFMNVNLVYI